MTKKKLLLSLLAAGACMAAGAATTTIYGYQNWQYAATTPQRGPVKFTSDNPGSVQLIADMSQQGTCYGGYYYNYKWYGQVIAAGTQSTVDGLYTIDMATGERTLVASGGSKAIDLTYDYSTGRVFGVRNGNQYLVELNTATGATTSLGQFVTTDGSSVYMLAIAASKAGVLYGIATNDTLYTINKATAACQAVGYTGVNAAYDQTMAFDYNTGTLYWANNADYHLYTVNTTTAAATDLGAIGPISEGTKGTNSLGSLFVPYIDVAVGAPDRVTGRSAVVSGSTVTLSWVNPSTDAQGQALTSLTAVKVLRNDTLIATVAASASDIGQAATYTDTALSDGQYAYSFVPVNDKGDGGVETDALQVTVGSDVPGPVASFNVVAGDNNAQLSWTAPTSGLNGGEFSPAGITKYVITRAGSSSGTIEVSDPATTTATDEPGFGTYTYSIAAYNAKGKGADVVSQPVLVKPDSWIVMGQGTATVENGKTYKFYDHNGTGYYSNSRADTITIAPAQSGSYVTVKFTTFSLDTYGDSLYVFNGPSVSSPEYGRFTDTSVPAELKTVEATNASGALTFVFVSDIMGRDQGWEADVTATAMKANDLVATGLSANLYPSAGEPVTYTVGVINKGVNTAQTYTVQLRGVGGTVLAEAQGPELASMQAGQVTLSYTPAEAGELQVSGYISYADDDDLNNNSTDTLTQTVVPAGSKYVTIATDEPADLYVLPTSFLCDEAIGQTVYPASRIGVAKDNYLQMISYPYYSCTNGYDAVPLRVWVGESEADSLSAGSIPASKLTEVFNGTIDIAAGDAALTIPIATPYPYGGGNLVIMMLKNGTGTSNGGITFRGTFGSYSTGVQCSRNDIRWSDDDPHLDPEANIGSYTSTMMPDVDLLFVPNPTGVASTLTPTARISAMRGAIAVTGLNGQPLSIYGIDGSVVYSAASVSSSATVQLPAGLYVVKAGPTAAKVAVK